MSEVRIYTVQDLEAIQAADIGTLTPAQLQELLPLLTTEAADKPYQHMLGVEIVAKALAAPQGKDAKACDVPDMQAGLDFLVQRWQHLAQLPGGPVIGFFDREGTTYAGMSPTVSIDGTVQDPEKAAGQLRYPIAAADHVFLPGAVEALRANQQRGFNILMTGQSGVVRGYFNEATVWAELGGVLRQARRHGVIFDAVLYCPHKPGVEDGDTRFAYDCGGRKGRGYGMLSEALALFRTVGVPVDTGRAFVVGDKADDVRTADDFNKALLAVRPGAAPIQGLLVDTGYAGGTNDALVEQMTTTYVHTPRGLSSIADLPLTLQQTGHYK